MGRVIVHDNVSVEIGRHVVIDLLKEIQKLGGAAPPLALVDHEAGGDVERGERRGGACRMKE